MSFTLLKNSLISSTKNLKLFKDSSNRWPQSLIHTSYRTWPTLLRGAKKTTLPSTCTLSRILKKQTLKPYFTPTSSLNSAKKSKLPSKLPKLYKNYTKIKYYTPTLKKIKSYLIINSTSTSLIGYSLTLSRKTLTQNSKKTLHSAIKHLNKLKTKTPTKKNQHLLRISGHLESLSPESSLNFTLTLNLRQTLDLLITSTINRIKESLFLTKISQISLREMEISNY